MVKHLAQQPFERQKTAAPITSAAVSSVGRVPQLRTIRRYFTLTRRKNEASASSGVTVVLNSMRYIIERQSLGA